MTTIAAAGFDGLLGTVAELRFTTSGVTKVRESVLAARPLHLASDGGELFVCLVDDSVVRVRFMESGSHFLERIELAGLPCHAVVVGNSLVVSLYRAGKIAFLSLDNSVPVYWRALPPGPRGPSHPHHTEVSPDGEYLIVSDAGADAVAVWERAAPHVEINRVALGEGVGPRNSVFCPSDASRLFVTGQDDSTLREFLWNGSTAALSDSGAWMSSRISGNLPSGIGANDLAVYQANREAGTIAMLPFDSGQTILECVSGGWPMAVLTFLHEGDRWCAVALRDFGKVEFRRVDDAGLLGPALVKIPIPGAVGLALA